MASKKVNIDISTKADTAGAKQAAGAMDGLAASTAKAGAATSSAAKGGIKVGQAMQAAGYQVQDFAVQVGAGTSALTAFAQNAPQFLSIFGPGGAIAGALVAVGAIAAKVFTDMGDDAVSASERAEQLADAIEKIGENAAKSVSEDIDFGREKIEQAKTAANLLAQEIRNYSESQISYNKTILDSLSKLAEAERIIRDLKGESISKVKDLAAEEKRAAEERAASVALQIQAENNKLASAEANVSIQKAAVDEAKKQKEEAQADLDVQRQKIEALRNQMALLKSQAKETQSMAGATGILPGAIISTPRPGATQAAIAAQKQLEDPALKTQLSVLEGRIKSLEESLDRTGKLSEALVSESEKLKAVESEFRQTQVDVSTAISSIEATAATEDLSARAKSAEEKAKAFATEVESMISGIEPVTQQQATALETLKQNLSDNQIKVNEIAETSSALATLSPLIRQSITENKTSVMELISIMNNFANSNASIRRDIENLKALINIRKLWPAN